MENNRTFIKLIENSIKTHWDLDALTGAAEIVSPLSISDRIFSR